MNWFKNLFRTPPQPKVWLTSAGTKPTAENVFVKRRDGNGTVYDVDRMAQALGRDMRDIVFGHWRRGSVELTIKNSVLAKGRGKGSRSAKAWGAEQ